MTYAPAGTLPKTDHVRMDEDAYVLYEVEKKTPDRQAFHRYRVLQVVRNDELYEYEEDMGDVSKFTATGFCIPGGGYDAQPVTIWTPNGQVVVGETKKTYWFEETVGSLIDAAEGVHKQPFDTSKILDNRTDLVAGYHEQIDRKRNRSKRQFATKGKDR